MAKTGTTIDELLQALDQLDTKEDGQMCTKNYNSRRREGSSFRERELKGKIEGSPGKECKRPREEFEVGCAHVHSQAPLLIDPASSHILTHR